jgi:uncharacterized protein
MRKSLLVALALSGCGIYHVQPISPATSPPPQTADAAAADTNCFESVTATEKLVCATPSLAAPNRAMVQALQADLRVADIFARDAVLASQRAWLLGLTAACHAPDTASCLARALSDRTAKLQSWQKPRAFSGPHAMAHYVVFEPLQFAQGQNDPAYCAGFASRANAALARTGTLDPAAMGGKNIAGSHGQPDAAQISVIMQQANVYGLYQIRARALRIGGTVVIDPLSLTSLVQAQANNSGGRFSPYASQTGDYGSIDVFRLDAGPLALVADAWGSDTPAASGEFAHAALWDVAATPPKPLCLFDIYQMPESDIGGAAFAAWRGVLAQIKDSAQLPLGTATLRTESQLRADTDFVLLHMPLLAVQQATQGAWTPWLRQRHDQVLDTLFAWSAAAPANKRVFEQLFATLRPAAQDLVNAYQQTQALSATEAKQAAALTLMELLYRSTITIAPTLGADLAAPSAAAGYTPRYPILAAPS